MNRGKSMYADFSDNQLARAIAKAKRQETIHTCIIECMEAELERRRIATQGNHLADCSDLMELLEGRQAR